MAEARASNPLVDQIRRGGVPLEVRQMAAEGALPLKPEDLVELLELMSHDPVAEVAGQARKTFAALPADEVLPVLKARDTPGEVLGWALAVRSEPRLMEACLQNPATPDEAIVPEAARLSEALAELVVINQTRLLRSGALLEAIERNPALSRDQKRRLMELRETFAIGVERKDVEEVAIRPGGAPAPQPSAAPVALPPSVVPPAPVPEPAPSDENAVAISPEEAAATILTEDEKKDEEKVSKLNRLFSLRTGQKIKEALQGDAQVRGFLIRDPNRLVATAVLGSPKITEAEVESFSGMKNVSDEVLRRIGTNRDWTKKYTVVANLAKNPRTPLPIAMGMVTRLLPKDMKSLATDKNAPEAIRKHAQRFLKSQLAGPGEKR